MAGLMDLFITIGVEDDASEKIRNITGSLGKGLKTAAKVGAAAVAAVGAGAVFLGKAFVKGATQVAAYGDKVDKASQKMGITAKAYQEWDFVLQHCGTSIDSMQRGMMTLTQAAENGNEAFSALGITQEEIASMSQDELFEATIEGLQGIEDSGERAVLAQKLLGVSAKELGPLLNMSAEDVKAMRDQVNALGGVMSDEAVAACAQFQDSLLNLQTAFGGVKNDMLVKFLPSITTVMDGLTKLMTGDKSGIGMIKDGIKQFSSQIMEVLPEVLEVIVEVLETLTEAVVEILPELIETLLPVLFDAVVKIIGALVEKLPEILGALWSALQTIGAELWPVLEEVFAGVGGWFEEKFDAAWGAIKGAFDELGITEFFTNVWGWITTAWGDVSGWFAKTFGGAYNEIVNAFQEEGVTGVFKTVWGWITTGLGDVVGWFAKTFGDAYNEVVNAFKEEGVTGAFSTIWGWITTGLGDVVGWFSTTFGGAWEAIKSAFDELGITEFFSGVWETVSSAFTDLGTTISTAIGGAVTAGINGIIQSAEDIVNDAIAIINDAIDLINKLPLVSVGHVDPVTFPRLAIGSDYVPFDEYPAMLHKGEAVLTASEAEEWRRGENGNKVENVFNFYGVSQSDMEMIADYVNRSLA